MDTPTYSRARCHRTNAVELLDQVHDQEIEVVVTKRGEVVARVVPADAHLPSAFGFLGGTLRSHGDLVAPDFEVWGDPG